MNFLFKSTAINVDSVVNSLIQLLQVKVTKSSINKNLFDHPEYPSLLAVGDCLTDYGITNQSYRIDKAEFDADDLLFPFIAHFPEMNGRFILVTSVADQTVNYTDEKTKKGTLSLEEFLKRWSGIALHAEANDQSGESNYKANRFNDFLQSLKAPVALLIFFGLVYFGFTSFTYSWQFIAIGSIKIFGVATSILLLIQSINASNPFVKNLCSFGGKNNCNAILKSDAAKITSWLSWSEVGLFYFAGTLLSLFFAPSSLILLAWLNLLALPYTVYSIVYQYKVKNWCILCCTVQALLATEAILFAFSHISYDVFTTTINLTTYALFFLCLAIPVIIWSFLKPFFIEASQLKPLKSQLKKFKYNSDLFQQALKNQPRYAIENDLMPITLGNPSAETVITMVSNPFCGPCAKAHQTIDEWLKNRDDIQLKVIFTSANDDDEPRTKVSRHMSALSKVDNKLAVEDALNDWYQMAAKDYKVWAAKHPAVISDELNMVTKRQAEWCDLVEITFTPTIFVNGYKLPDLYRLEDIKYLLS